jgi:hypothetical protein
MDTALPDNRADRPAAETVRDVTKLVIEHPIPLYDPAWLRRLHNRCLWDGGIRTARSDFCCPRCEERYGDWEHHTTHAIVGREPLQTFFEQGREL